MTKGIKIYDDDADRINELVETADELTWPAKVNKVLDKAEKQ
jgi:hypothetical protein